MIKYQFIQEPKANRRVLAEMCLSDHEQHSVQNVEVLRPFVTGSRSLRLSGHSVFRAPGACHGRWLHYNSAVPRISTPPRYPVLGP